MWRTIESGRLWHDEIRNRAKDGSPYWVDTTIVPCVDARGRPVQYIAIRHDITRRRQVEAELREQAALTRLGEMAAVVAHELKNPLAGVRGARRGGGGAPRARVGPPPPGPEKGGGSRSSRPSIGVRASACGSPAAPSSCT